jgi:hypothetical protein
VPVLRRDDEVVVGAVLGDVERDRVGDGVTAVDGERTALAERRLDVHHEQSSVGALAGGGRAGLLWAGHLFNLASPPARCTEHRG